MLADATGSIEALGAVDRLYWTPGWGSLATVAVGLLAILVSSIVSARTLKRSAETLKLAEKSFERTEERYREDRKAAFNEKILGAVLDTAYEARKTERILREFELYLRVLSVEVAAGRETVQRAKDAALFEIERNIPAVGDAARSIEATLILTHHIQPLQTQLAKVSALMNGTKQGRTFKHPLAADSLLQSADTLKATRVELLQEVAVMVVVASGLLKPKPPE